MTEVIALVNYYARQGYYRHVQTVVNEVLKKRGGTDNTLVFWRALGMLKEGSLQEAIREYESVAARGDMQLALPVKLALLHAHEQSKFVDHDEVARLRNELSAEEANAPDRARLQAALLLWHLGDHEQAKYHVNQLISLQPHSVPALTLLGWLELQEAEMSDALGSPDEFTHRVSVAEMTFNKALEACSAKKDLEALMGRVRLHQVKEQHKEALDQLNQVIVLYSWFLPALVEKFQVLMAMGDWEQAVETAERVRSQDQHNIEALRITVLYLLSQESRYAVAASRLSDLIDALGRHEPLNAQLYYRVARPLARLAGRHHGVLQLTLSLMERACKLSPQTCAYAAEYGYQQMLLGDIAGAVATLKRASTLGEGSQEVLQYQIKAQILSGHVEEAEQQLEFLTEVMSAQDRTPEMALCGSLIAQRQGKPNIEALRMLDEALELHMRAVRKLPYNDEYFVKLNPDLLLEIAREYLKRCGSEPQVLEGGSAGEIVLSKATKLLEMVVTKQVPGLLDGQMLLAQAKFIGSDFEAALRCCNVCIKADPTFASASLLQAQILLRQERFQQAHSVLEQALSHNFAVRESPLFHLCKAKVLQTQGDLQEAAKILEAAMKLPGVANEASKLAVAAALNNGMPELSLYDRCSIYLQLVDVHLALGQSGAANSLMQQAIYQFDGGPQEGRVTIANAQVELKKGDVEKALTMLRGVPSDNPHYHTARKALAELYLTHRNDRRMYAMCHEELVKANPSVSSYVMLGEAYMTISEPQKAIASFERALRTSPGDSALASRIGKVLVTTHEYVKAIEYYSSAVGKDPSKSVLRHELAELYLELKKYDQAQKELAQLLADERMSERDLDEAYQQVTSLALLARVYKEQEMLSDAVSALMRARSAQTNVLTRVRVEAPDQLASQREVAASLCSQLASYHEWQKDTDRALGFYEEALKHQESHERAMLALARLHLNRGELEAAQNQCVTLMRIDPGNQDASMMLADLMLQKSEWEAAIYHFQQLLEKTPAHFRAMVKLLQLLRRAGRLKEASRFLKQAERSSPRAALEPGYRFCQGLLHRYLNDPRAALKAFNMARRDAEWGETAVQNMIEIYLNPENETNWDELVLDRGEEPSEAVRASEKLLRELPFSPRQQVLECYTLMCYKTKSHLEKAVSTLLELLNTEREYLPALVCLSQAYLMLKQAPKARNHLKRVAKMQFMAEMADDFERGWLMLSDVYIVSGKYDLAEELCRRCLASNKSCAKAWEFLGVVKEKEMSYKDAASHYENAWRFENEASAAVGYKLSFNYLKAKKYVDAINVCHKVLTQYPDYPKIRKDVLEKARQALRP